MNKRELLGLGVTGLGISGLGAFIGTTAMAGTVNAAGNLPVLSTPDKPAAGAPLPKDWIDRDTGYRVVRLSNQDHTVSLYFNVPAYSPDGRWMVVQRTDGISKIDMKTFEEKNLADGYSIMCTAASKPLVFATRRARRMPGEPTEYFTIDINTGEVKSLLRTDQGGLVCVNADGTLVAGTVTHGSYTPPTAPGQKIDLGARLAAKLPMEIFTINVATGERRVLTHSDGDWLNHLQFSPTDPNLLLYCHEGPWHMVDRIWTIRTDGTQQTQIHRRTMNMEIAGHEFFSWDGEQVLYDLQTPRGEDFWVASYNLRTGKRIWYHLEDRNYWSVHFNISKDGAMLAGDGGQPSAVAHAPDGKWIWLFRPEIIQDMGTSAPDASVLIRPARTRAERLVNMQSHDYALEPNVRFSPDGKWLFFRSNMHGPTHSYAVAVEKS